MRGRLVPTDIDSSPTPESVAPLVRSADNNLATSSTEWEQPADTAVPLLVVVSCGIRRRGQGVLRWIMIFEYRTMHVCNVHRATTYTTNLSFAVRRKDLGDHVP